MRRTIEPRRISVQTYVHRKDKMHSKSVEFGISAEIIKEKTTEGMWIEQKLFRASICLSGIYVCVGGDEKQIDKHTTRLSRRFYT